MTDLAGRSQIPGTAGQSGRQTTTSTEGDMGGKPYRGVDLAPINNGAGPFTGREATGFGGECVVLLCFLQREPESRYCTHHKDWSGREASSTTPVLDLLTGDPDV